MSGRCCNAVGVWLGFALVSGDIGAWTGRCAAADPETTGKKDLPGALRFEPAWRRKGDCGPLSLFVLMRLNDHPVTIEEIETVVPFDEERGCTLADLARGSEQLGFATEVRFVKPQDFARLPTPFIVHTNGSLEKGIGHYAVIVDCFPSEHEFSVIDTTYELFRRQTEGSILTNYSGYVLVLKPSALARLKPVGIMTLCMAGAILLIGRPGRVISSLCAVFGIRGKAKSRKLNG